MRVEIAQGPVDLQPLPAQKSSGPRAQLTVRLTPPPDTEWLKVFYSDDIAKQFYSVRPRDFEIDGARCSHACPDGKHERALRILRRIMDLTNQRTAPSHTD